ncbi:MAG TPA: hypothetical protein VEZ90_01845 [Blastocatellia bacterium]|nr:hypothetical protein [Blastocatellia bacterium]
MSATIGEDRIHRDQTNRTEPVTRFVIIAAPRTGSNLLCSLLNSHPDVLCHHELFNPDAVHYCLDRPAFLDFGSKEDRDREPLGFLDRVWENSLDNLAVGFKLNRGQNRLVYQTVLADRSVRKIVLVRLNRVKTCVSEQLAQQTGRWESHGSGDFRLDQVKLELDPDELFRHINLNNVFYDWVYKTLRDSNQEYLDTAYERLSSKDEWVRILRFLRVDPTQADLVPRTRKQTPRDLRTIIANFDEVASALRGSDLYGQLCSVDRD